MDDEDDSKPNYFKAAEISEDLRYVLKRLVRGLASSRKGARQGFSTALSYALSKFAEVGAASFAALRHAEPCIVDYSLERHLRVAVGKQQDPRQP